MSTRYTIHNGMVPPTNPKARWKTRSWAMMVLLGLYLSSVWGPGGTARAQTYCAPTGTFYAPLENAGRNYSPTKSSVATVPRYARGSAAYSTTSKVGASSASFNGTSQYIRLDSLAGTAANSFLIRGYSTVTVMFWVQAGRTTGVQTLFEEGTTGAGLGIRLNNTTLQARVARATGASSTFDVSAPFPTDGAWHHIALTWGAWGIMRLYVDGVEVAQNANIGTGAIPNHNDQGGLGATMGNGSVWGALPTGTTTSQFFQGRIDDFVYSYSNDLNVLTAAQIQSYIACVNSQPTNTFTCDGAVYIPQGVSSGQPTTLKRYSYATNTFVNVDTDAEILYNAAGYNQVDHFIYAIQSTNVTLMNHIAQTDNNLVRIGKDGTVTQLGPVAALPSVSNGMFHVGDVSPSGLMYVNDGSQNLYRIDLNTFPYVCTTIPVSQNMALSDMAWNPVDNFLYGVNATTNQIMKINPTTGAVTAITANPAYNLSGSGWGAVWFDQFNNFYTYYNTGVIDRISLPSGQRTRIKSNAPAVNTNDAAACPFSYVDPQITKTVFSQSGNTVTFEIELQNNGPSIAADVVMRDILPTQLLYQSAQVLNENGQVLAAAGNYNITAPAVGQTGTVQLHLLDLNVGAANKRTLRITARLASGCNATVNNCAEIISTFGSTANNGTLGNTTDNTTTIPGDVAANNESCTSVTFAQPDSPTVMASTTGALCSGESFSITYTSSSPGQQVAWQRLPDGLIGTGNVSDAVSNTSTAPQSYTYNAWVVGVSGCNSTTVTTSITVNPVPIVTPSTCSQTICSGEAGSITFVSSVPDSTIHWLRVEDNLAGTGDISEVMNTAGSFTYKIWATSPAPASCPSSTTITCEVVVNECAPSCDLSASISSAPSTNCTTPNGSFTLTYGGSGSYQYSLNGGANTTLTASPLVISNLAPGSYTLVVSDVASTTCSSTQVFVILGADLTVYANSNSPICATNTLELYAIGSGGSGTLTYSWSGPNGFSNATQNPAIANVSPAATGVYTVQVSDEGGCTVTASTTVTVANQPSLTISSGAGSTICSGQSTTLLVGGENGATVSWSNNLGQSGTGTSIETGVHENRGTQPGVIVYTVVATAGGSCTDIKSFSLVVNPAPIVNVVPISAVYCSIEQVKLTATASGIGSTINWSRTPAIPNPPADSGSGVGSVTIEQTLPAGAYTYQFTAAGTNGCTSQSASVPVTVQQ